MKKVNLFVIGVIALFGFGITAHAANSVALICSDNRKELKIGESTNCYVKINSESTIHAAQITLSTSEYLKVSNVKANTASGWTGANLTGPNYTFNSTAGSTGPSQLFSFDITLTDGAKKLSAGDDCGQLCISGYLFDGVGDQNLTKSTGICFSPTVVEEKCIGSGCNPTNPNTGEFMNYVIIGGVALIAVAAVVIAKKSNKFFKI